MSVTVSVVVPVYNTERYLDRCVGNVLGQTFSDFELILVDDGSGDSSPELCDLWAKKDPRIRVIHKENGGAGLARNAGIDVARGKYICFFDSDDHVDSDLLEICVKSAEEHGADMVCYGYDQRDSENDEVQSVSVPSPAKNVFCGDEVMDVLLPMSLSQNAESGEDWNLTLSACTRLFSAKVILDSGWRFVSEREVASEDFYSLTELHQYIKKAVVINRVMYHYTVNYGSFSRSYTPDRLIKLNSFAESMRSLSERMGCARMLSASIDTAYLGLVMGALKQAVRADMGLCDRYKAIGRIVKDFELQAVLKRHCYSGENLQKKILFFCIKHRLSAICYVIVAMKAKLDNY